MRPPDEDDLEEFGLAGTSPDVFRDVPQVLTRPVGQGSLVEDRIIPAIHDGSVFDTDNWSDIVGEQLSSSSIEAVGAVEVLKRLRDALGARVSRSKPVMLQRQIPSQAVTATPLSFSSGNILPGDSATMVVRQMQIFRLKSITAIESVPGNIEINAIFFGAMNLFSTPNAALPCRFFAPGIPSTVAVPRTTAQVGLDITVMVKNVGSSPCRVDILLQGKTLR